MKTKITLLILLMIVFINTSHSQITFQKTIGGTANENGNCVKQTSDGGYIMTGSTTSFGAGMEDVYLVKTDASVTIQWTKTYGGTNKDVGDYVEQTSDVGYII